MDDDECGAIGGMIGRGTRSTLRKSASVLIVHHKSHIVNRPRVSLMNCEEQRLELYLVNYEMNSFLLYCDSQNMIICDSQSGILRR
jgi:hypothetical protein